MANTLQLVLSVDNRAGNQAIGQFNQALSSVDRQAVQVSQGASRAFGQVDQSAVRVAASVKRSFSGLGAVLGIGGFAGLVKMTADLEFGFERARIGLKAFTGDAQKAEQLFKDLQQYAQSSPFQFKDLLEGTNRLLAFRFRAEETLPALKAMSAAVAAIGGNDQRAKINELITAIGQIRAAGHLTGEELRQLRNVGIPALDYLSKGFGVTTGQMQKMISDGAVPAEAAIRVLLRSMEQEFGRFQDEVSNTASVSFSNLLDTIQKVTDDVTSRYLPEIRDGIEQLRSKIVDLGDWLKANPDFLGNLAKGIAAVGSAIVASKIIVGINNLRIALVGLNIAALATPWGLIAAGAAAGAFAAWDAQRAFQALKKTQVDDAIVSGLLKDGKTVQQMEELGYSADHVKEVLGDSGFKGPAPGWDLGIKLIGVDIPQAAKDGTAALETFNTAEADGEKIAKSRADAEKQAAQILREAQLSELDGIERIKLEYADQIKVLGLTAKAKQDLYQAATIRAGQEAQRVAKETQSLLDKAARDFEKNSAKSANALSSDEQAALDARNRAIVDSVQQAKGYQAQLAADRVQRERDSATQIRDEQLRQLQLVNAQTVQEQLAIEQQREQIEEQYLQTVGQLEQDAIRQRYDKELQQLEVLHRAKIVSEESYLSQKQVLETAASEAIAGQQQATQAEIDAAKQNASIASNQIIGNANKELFNQYKQEATNAINAFVYASRGGASSFKQIWLSALRDIISSQFARLMFRLSGGGGLAAGGAGGTGGGGGLLGSLGGLLGLGGLPSFGVGSIGPGGTSGFAGPVQLGAKAAGGLIPGLGLGGAGGAVNTIPFPQVSGTGGLFAGLKGFAGGTGGLLLGGGLLASTFGRSGAGNFLGSVAGGALAGFSIGGPIGAAVGAGVGLIGGLIGVFRTSAEEKIVKRVKDLYGVTLDKKYAKDPLLGIIKSQFGGNIDAGLRSPQIRDMIELYAMTTGQNSQGIVARATPAVFTNRGGSLTQTPVYQNGAPVLAGSTAAASAPGGGVTVLKLDGAATQQLLQGQAVQAVQRNPRTVTRANLAGQRQSTGNRESMAAMLNPSFVFA